MRCPTFEAAHRWIGAGTAGSTYTPGQQGGAEAVTLTVEQLPPHRHSVAGDSTASSARPTGHVPATTVQRGSYGDSPDVTLDEQMIGETGGGEPPENRPPFSAVNWCIALSGAFPARN